MTNNREQHLQTPDTTVREQNSWREVLGTKIEVPSVPNLVTPEVKRNLESLGFALRYIPKLDLGTIDELKGKELKDFLNLIQYRYPNWRRYEALTSEQQGNPSITRNIEEYFWDQVKKGEVDFPKLQGIWIAVETMPKPSRGSIYVKNKVDEKLGLGDRFNVSWNDVQQTIQAHKRGLLTNVGLPDFTKVRLLEALEWNLLANREGWGTTNTCEWSNTRSRDGDLRLIVGDSNTGDYFSDDYDYLEGIYGAAYAKWREPGYSGEEIFFRLALILGT